MLRRNLLKAALGSALLLPVGRSAMALVNSAPEVATSRLIVVLLRGAVDGLSVVVPYGDDAYYRARRAIAIAPPGREGGGLLLDARFALHPALLPLMPYWDAGQMAFVHAVGSPDPTRSHFDAQDYMESGTPGRKSTADGWMNRLIGELPHPNGQPIGALNLGPVLPRILAGREAVAALPSGRAATRPTPLDRPRISVAFDRLYDGEDRLSRAYRVSQVSHREIMTALTREAGSTMQDAEMQAANNGAPLPDGLPGDVQRLARLMRSDSRIRLAFVAIGGWDTHANQGAARGQLANRLVPLGTGLADLATGLGPVFDDTVVVVMSEFGRTVRQNGNGGTDHGHANAMWLLGGSVAGGEVHGQWPGLQESELYEGRDLAVTTDFRTVLSSIAREHLGLGEAQLDRLFPGFGAGAADSYLRRR